MRVIYLDVDSLRPDHLGCYGYHRNTSPNVDRLAAEGVRFTGYHASDVPCLPSRTAFFLGRPGVVTGVVNHGGEMSDLAPQGRTRHFRSEYSEHALAAVLRRAGYHTASISPFPERHSAYQMTYGFHETCDTGRGGQDDAHEIFPHVERWLRARGQGDNWFLHVNFWDPHTPYDHPAEFGNPFADDPIAPWIDQPLLDAQNASYGPHGAAEVPGWNEKLPPHWRMGAGRIRGLDDAKAHLDGYDTGIRYFDHHLGLLLGLLEELGIADDVALVVSADHGENQGELNVWGDHQTADAITCRLPLVVRWPGRTDDRAGAAIDGLYYHFDFAATLADWLGAAIPPTWHGRPIDLDGPGRDTLVLSQGAWSCQRAVRWDRWLMIRTYHTGYKAFPEVMLFDLVDDPHETRDLAAARPDLVGEGLRRLDRWLAGHMAEGRRGDPFWTVIQEGGPLHANDHDPQIAAYLERLRATGRAAHADRLAQLKGRPIDSA